MPATKDNDVYRDVGGIYVSHIFNESRLLSAMTYKARPDDIFVVGYPKCGTTWMQYIVYAILNDGAAPRNLAELLQESPFLEYVGAEAVMAAPMARPIKTHLPFDKAPFSDRAKYVYICRNPYDCCVSFYHHTTSFPVYRFEDGTFDQFLDMFLGGKVDCGDYFDQLLSWYEHRDKPNIMWVTYEDLKRDTRSYVLKIARFLGEKYATKLRDHPESMDSILEMISVESMRSFNGEFRSFTLAANGRQDFLGGSGNSSGTAALLRKPMTGDFIRKGVIGDWVSHFTADQVQRMKARIGEKTEGSDVMKLWEAMGLP